ncbi:MAG: anhydro-N-acetylmuramic acid kinase [Alphaproteobacteria bacterium]|nr:anhydro-N-acetylmuramic acid kinase [Alphaproteobacteria bacterium]
MADMIPIIGLMAGTSVDGIDAALIFSDGKRVERTPHALTTPYDKKTRAAIFNAFEDPKGNHDALDVMIAQDHARACEMLIAEAGLSPKLIGFHGQTIFHDPDHGVSMQQGNAHYLAMRLGVAVAHQFRQNDLKHGGQGAPLAPIYHQALMTAMNLPLPAALVNIGGISNLSLWDGARLTGFDTGPGNALMDDAMRGHDGSSLDHNGAMAARGTADDDVITAIMSHPYFQKTGPKSIDRMALYDFLDDSGIEGLPIEDRLASLTRLTARSIIDGARRNAPDLKALVVCGGGGFNPSLMAMIRAEAPTLTVHRMEDHGMDSGFIEAELMGFLAARCKAGLPLTFPETTGVAEPVTGGSIITPQPK